MADFRKTLPALRLNTTGMDGNLSLVRRNTYAIDSTEKTVEKDGDGQKDKGAYSFDFIGLCVVTQLIMKWVHSLSHTGENFLYMGYHVPAPTMQVYSAITSLPGTLKPLVGLMSDVFPVMGYSKTPYAILFSITGLIGMFACAFSPQHPMPTGVAALMAPPSKSTSAFTLPLLVTCLFFGNLMIATSETFTSGVLAEKVNKTGSAGGSDSGKAFNLIGMFVVMGMLAGLGAGYVCGYVLTHQGPPKLYFISACMATSLPLWVMFRGFGDSKLTQEQLTRNRQFIARQKEIVGLTILLSVGCLFMLFVPMAAGNGTLVNFIVAVGTSAVIITTFCVLLTPAVARLLFCFFIFTCSDFNIAGALQYFSMDNEWQFQGGPNFSKMFVTFWMPVGGTISGLAGCIVFKTFGQRWHLRTWELMATLMMIPVLLGKIAWIYRLNLSWGISDEIWAYVESCLWAFVFALQQMPYTFALPRVCPVGLESSMMQLLGGCLFMGGIVAEDIGALLLQMWDVSPSGGFLEQDKFKNFGVVMVIKSAICVAATLMVIPLLPSAPIADQLIQNDRPDAATYGSVWKTWMKKRAVGKEASATA